MDHFGQIMDENSGLHVWFTITDIDIYDYHRYGKFAFRKDELALLFSTDTPHRIQGAFYYYVAISKETLNRLSNPPQIGDPVYIIHGHRQSLDETSQYSRRLLLS
jgi:hypothetical protein